MPGVEPRVMMPCLFCDGDLAAPDHWQHCDGRQGTVEAAEPDEPELKMPDVRDENFARTSDPETSHEAARSVDEDAMTETRQAIMRIVRACPPLSDEQIRPRLSAAGVHVSPSGARTRRSELVHAGLIIDSGQRGVTAAGRATILWTAATKEQTQ